MQLTQAGTHPHIYVQEETQKEHMGKTLKEKEKDQVNNANSAFIFMINLLIIQGCQSGSVGRGDQLVRLVRLIWWSR